METTYYAKTKENGHQTTVEEHCTAVANMAQLFGAEIGCEKEAELAGLFHDFGKYGRRFQNVLLGTQHHIDHAICGAAVLYGVYKGKLNWSVLEAINGHHDGLLEREQLESRIRENIKRESPIENDEGKFSSLAGKKEYSEALAAFCADHPHWRPPNIRATSANSRVEQMLNTRMLFSCLVDADYSVSAKESAGVEQEEDPEFEPQQVLDAMYRYQKGLSEKSIAQSELNQLRSKLFWRCGEAGASADGLCTLTAPTGTGKTLALLHFALQQCVARNKKRIIIVLPYLSIIQQNAGIYRSIYPRILEDHSQSNLDDSEREYAARWSAPIIVTTSVRFFETLFSSSPTDCRKLHNIANSVVVFDEAQSLPPEVTATTLQAVQTLCQRYHTTVLFSTATQPDYAALPESTWSPREILPNYAQFYHALKRTRVEWRVGRGEEIPLERIAEEMSVERSVCAIVNMRSHAKRLYRLLASRCPREEVFFLTTDLCAADRLQRIAVIQERLSQEKTCRVVATQCIEAGVDFDFDVVYRALAPLEAIIQAAGRCNRNGRLSEGGRVVVFIPNELGRCYPGIWYESAAHITQALNMEHEIDIDNPEHIREYYRLIFAEAKDKRELREAVQEGSYKQVERVYQLIESKGIRFLVPAKAEAPLYRNAVEQAMKVGMTPKLMKETAAITVECYPRYGLDLEMYADPILYADRGGRKGEPSGFYVLRSQYEKLYSTEVGLEFPEQEQHIGDLLYY